MQIIPTGIPDLVEINLVRHTDARGFFCETWREEWGRRLNLSRPFIQDNHACSAQSGVVRGLHFQLPPNPQAKLIWAVRGAVFDVAVDLRVGSPTYGRWHGLILSADNGRRFFVPEGFAHGYMALEPDTEILYKVSAYYDPKADRGLAFDDPELGIPWPGLEPVLSDKDNAWPRLTSLESPFVYRNKQ